MVLQGKNIFLTGGASGIGEACVQAYAQAGASVFVMDVHAGRLAACLSKAGDAHDGFVGDVSIRTDVEAAMRKMIHTFGKIDVIHNNAGMAHPSKTLDETTEEEWDALLDVNLKSVLWTTKYGLPYLKSTRGCIINTSSLVGELGQAMHAAYTATKGGMNALSKSMALDYAPFGIRVNAVSPAGVWTPMLRDWIKEQPDPAAVEQALNDMHPLGHCPEGDVVAQVCVFLASDAARFVTGCILPVGGGAELGYRR